MTKMYGTFKNISTDISKEMKNNARESWIKDFSKKEENHNGIKDLTFKDRAFTCKNLRVIFKDYGNNKNPKDLQLLVFFNKDLKYASKKGIFDIEEYQHHTSTRVGWFKYEHEYTTKQKVVFAKENDCRNFEKFCMEVKDCNRLKQMFKELSYNYMNGAEVATEVKPQSKVYPKVQLDS